MNRIIFHLLILLFATSCSEELSDITINDTKNNSEIILQKRNPKLPSIWAKRRQFNKSRGDFGVIPVEKYMGRAYRIGNTILGDIMNVGAPVINIEQLQQTHPTYITSDYIRTAHSAFTSYSTYDRYEKQSTVTQKVSSGFNLNLGLFKIGRQKSTTEKFYDFLSNSQKSVFGETEIEVRHRKHELQTISSARKRMAANFLHEEFLDALYNVPLQEVIDEFGLFVITKYYSGGRASAMYYGITYANKTEEFREKGMNVLMNASCKWNGGSDSASLELGNINGNIYNTIIEYNFSSTYYTVSTQGGSYSYNIPAQNTLLNYTDLSSWLESLNNENTHVLTGFMDQGLYPISDFILEENFKQRINDTHSEYITSSELHEPFIEIAKVYVRTSGGEKLYKAAPVLHSRQGDLLILSDGLDQSTDEALRANNNNTTFMQRANTITANKSQYYQCRIEANPTKIINPILRIPLNFDISNLNESRMCKFKNPDTEMWYIYDPVGKIAYSYYFDEYILEVYGILDWINSIPEKSISMTSLYQLYRIMGL